MKYTPVVICIVTLASAGTLAFSTGVVDAAHSLEETRIFDISELRVGDAADYRSSSGDEFTIQIHSTHETRDRANRPIQTIAVSIVPSSSPTYTVEIGTKSRLIESMAHVRTTGQDEPTGWVDASWMSQGNPGLMGASILLGRQVSIGSFWTLADDCASCDQPIGIEILGAGPDSPVGTDFRVAISGSPGSRYSQPAPLLHMNESLAFPLQADYLSQSYTMVSYRPGSKWIELPPREAAAYPPPVASIPFSTIYPPEGRPLDGHPSFATAMEGANGASAPPGRTVRSLTYLQGGSTIGSGSSTAVTSRDKIWIVQFTQDGQKDRVERYTQTSYFPDILQSDAVTTGWSKETSTEETTPPTTLTAAIPLWDAARFGLQTPYLSRFGGIGYYAEGDHASVYVFGAIHESFGEGIGLDAQSGLLQSASVWVGD